MSPNRILGSKEGHLILEVWILLPKLDRYNRSLR
jgi:hypothetical protein